MQFQLSGVPGNVISKLGFHSRRFGSINLQSISKLRENHKELLSKLLDRRWALPHPDTQIHRISLSEREEEHGDVPNFMFAFSNNTRPSLGGSLKEKRKEVSFSVVRDDLLHPFVNGNKARKLDGLLPLLEDHLVTDVVTCGGCQSAHAASVERGLRSHLLLRGEQPEIPTGYNLISTMYGNVTYVPRSLYAEREEMLSRHADLVAGTNGSVIWLDNILDTPLWAQESEKAKFVPLDGNQIVFTQLDAKEHPRKVAIVNEGAGDAVALLGLSEDLWSLNIEKDLLIRYTILHRVIRIVEYLSRPPLFGGDQVLKIVVDAGTGTTAVGLGLGAVCLGLPWEVCGVMLANSIEGYKKQEKHLINEFKRLYGIGHVGHAWNGVDGGIVHWVERTRPRKFGNILKGEVEMCRQIAQQTGILVDPVYTLAAWEHAMLLCRRQIDVDAQVVMLHTGGTLGMFGLAQRYKSFFHRIQ